MRVFDEARKEHAVDEEESPEERVREDPRADTDRGDVARCHEEVNGNEAGDGRAPKRNVIDPKIRIYEAAAKLLGSNVI